MKNYFGYSSKQSFLRDWMFYVSIQVIIFIKTVIFFFLFGHGISYVGQPVVANLLFVALPVFGNPVHVGDFLFHQLMHVLIAVWVLLLAKHVKKVDWFELGVLFFIATVLHNVGYWLTRAHPSWAYSFRDFGVDFVALFIFFIIFRLGLALVPVSRKWKIPYFDESL